MNSQNTTKTKNRESKERGTIVLTTILMHLRRVQQAKKTNLVLLTKATKP